MMCVVFFFFFKHKTAYEMRISDWSSDVCSSDLLAALCPASAFLRSSSTSSFFDSLPISVFGNASRISMATGISCLPSLSFRKSLSCSRVKVAAHGFSLMKALADWPRYWSGQIGRAHVGHHVTHTHPVIRLMLD